MKKITFFLLTLFSSFATAGNMGCLSSNIQEPCTIRSWDLGVDALYLQPTFGTAASLVGTEQYYTRNNQWHWGYALSGSYHGQHGQDAVLQWMHIDGRSSTHGEFSGLTPLDDVAVFSVESRTQFDRVNLVAAQRIDADYSKSVRYYAGAQYLNIKDTLGRIYQPTLTSISLDIGRITYESNRDYHGLGPVIGFDYQAPLGNGFYMLANTEGSMLYGRTRTNASFAYAPTGLVPSVVIARQNIIVPGLAAKLGVSYKRAILDGVLNCVAGYQALNYFSPFMSVASLTAPTYSNFGLYGPYLSFNWTSNI